MTQPRISHYTATSALGHGLAAQREALLTGRSGLKPQAFDDCRLDCWVGEVSGLDRPLPDAWRPWDCRNNRLAWLALQQDDFLAQAHRLRGRYGAARVGVFIGTSTGGMHSGELAFREMTPAGALPDWFDYRHTQSISSPAEFTASVLQLSGLTLAISTACSSSAKVFAAASRALQAGFCDAALVGGVDSLCLTTLHGFNTLQLLSREVCRPADVDRNGISIGEAAGFAILEHAAAAPAGAPALLGYGESSDAHHMSSPHPQGRGAAAAMRLALQRGGVRPEDVDYINLHGTGTQANDAAEDQGVIAVFGRQTPCSSTKGWTGHTLGAAGIIEATLALQCIEAGLLPCSLQTRNPDPALHAAVLLETRRAPVRHALSNSFGFGGSNCSLLFGAAA